MKMKLLWCCFVAALALTHAAVDVEKTVKQVQSILQQHSQLPRLSRDEIIQLLHDIRAEDAKSASREKSKETTESYSTESKEFQYKSTEAYGKDSDNEVHSYVELTALEDVSTKDKYAGVSASTESTAQTIKSSEPTVMVVLPYTPRDASSLQELYTKPPRFEVVPESQVTPEGSKKPTVAKTKLTSNEKIKETLTNNVKLAKKHQKQEIPAEFQQFLNTPGLAGNPGDYHFLLPLEGFKPLPTPKAVNGTVEYPENILLTYDLVAHESEIVPESDPLSPSHVMYEPLKPEYPFELQSSPSESQHTVLPLDLPKKRLTKSTNNPDQPNYDPIDYDSVKVIPLQLGPKPEEQAEVVLFETDNSKRQAENETVSSENLTTTEEPSTSAGVEEKDLTTAAPVDSSGVGSDAGASIADLEESFGGAAPVEPGDSELPPPRKNGFYWMLDLNHFLEVGDGDTKVNIRLEPKLGDPQMFLPVNVP
ncbi:hypothetical protein JYU34_013248 [Plutella xylostella]|uniref:Uncharacterized protein n=1 Tax=Plutella xylostella TaxID=51655 RepID=A0ABQ7Q9E7_PLUXY|nr:hypothetical protein JYU34_013248 [Plutella xylostella]